MSGKSTSWMRKNFLRYLKGFKYSGVSITSFIALFRFCTFVMEVETQLLFHSTGWCKWCWVGCCVFGSAERSPVFLVLPRYLVCPWLCQETCNFSDSPEWAAVSLVVKEDPLRLSGSAKGCAVPPVHCLSGVPVVVSDWGITLLLLLRDPSCLWQYQVIYYFCGSTKWVAVIFYPLPRLSNACNANNRVITLSGSPINLSNFSLFPSSDW